MRYFDSRDTSLTVRHVMASGALPPAFPAVRIDGDLYWDGGILSNTPGEVVFDDYPRRNSMIFAAHMWNPDGAKPQTIDDVVHRHKDMQYASRLATHIARQKDTHRLRHIIHQLASHLPKSVRSKSEVRELLGYGCKSYMHVVRLLAPSLEQDDQTKDVDFRPLGIRTRWEAGYAKTMRALEQAPWNDAFNPIEGVILHEPRD